MTKKRQTVVVIGAGPAGLTAAWELLKNQSPQTPLRVVVLEASTQVGGIARTVNYRGNRMDMGGHRFFSRLPLINDWWEEMLPHQGQPAYDDRVLGRAVPLATGGPDPEKVDAVMLRRQRVSRIFFAGRFFDYPITLSWQTLKNLGLTTTLAVGSSYLWARLRPRRENSLEDFYINRFGRRLYQMFFENYTQNLWGRHPSQIDPSWGAQRVKGVSVAAVLRHAVKKLFGQRDAHPETSLIEEFSYPKLGPGQLWETVAAKTQAAGGEVILAAPVTAIKQENDRVTAVTYTHHGQKKQLACDYLISSLPLQDLVAITNDIPVRIQQLAADLPYRDYLTVGVLVSRLALSNQTKLPTIGNIIPDDWVYIHDRSVKMGRLQIYNNWSPYLVKDIDNTVWLGLEYFCSERDELWHYSERELATLALVELTRLGIISDPGVALDWHVQRVPKAYPAYFDGYQHIDELIAYLNTRENLFCIGRNGQHRYNNMDHSMLTGILAARAIGSGQTDKSDLWSVNT